MSHRLMLVRHGESVANRDGIVQGHLDSPLSDLGRSQAETLATSLRSSAAHFDRLLTSPLLRARQTAEVLADRLKLTLEADPIWKERNLGQAQGMPLAEFLARSQRHPVVSPFEPPFEGAEGAWDLQARAARALQSILVRPPGDYLIVSHGGLLNAALRAVLGIAPVPNRAPRFHFANGGCARISMDDDGSWTLHGLVNPADDASEEVEA